MSAIRGRFHSFSDHLLSFFVHQAEQGSTGSTSRELGPGRSTLHDQVSPGLKYTSSPLDGGSAPTIEGDKGALPGQPLSFMALGPITEGKLYSDGEASSNTLGMTTESSGLKALIGSRESSGGVETTVMRDRSGLSTSTSEDGGDGDKLLPDSWGEDWWPERGTTRPKQTKPDGVTSTPEDGQGEEEEEKKLLPDSWGEDWWPEGHRRTNRPERVVSETLHESWQPLAAG